MRPPDLPDPVRSAVATRCRLIAELKKLETRNGAQNRAHALPVLDGPLGSAVIVNSDPFVNRPDEGDAIDVPRDESRDGLVGERDSLLFGDYIVVVVVARRTPHEDVSCTVAAEMSHAVRRNATRGFRLAVTQMNYPTAVGRSPGGIEIEAHHPDEVDDCPDQVRGSQHIAAEIEQQFFAYRSRRCRPIDVGLLLPHELKVRESIDLREVLAYGELIHRYHPHSRPETDAYGNR